jgi:hypothetical protein
MFDGTNHSLTSKITFMFTSRRRYKMLNKCILFLAAFLAGAMNGSLAAAENEPSMRDILSIANMTGVCMILQSMSDFQASKKLEGGDRFIDQFWSAEAAKLGKTPEQFVKDCQTSIDGYERLWKLSGEASK